MGGAADPAANGPWLRSRAVESADRAPYLRTQVRDPGRLDRSVGGAHATHDVDGPGSRPAPGRVLVRAGGPGGRAGVLTSRRPASRSPTRPRRSRHRTLPTDEYAEADPLRAARGRRMRPTRRRCRRRCRPGRDHPAPADVDAAPAGRRELRGRPAPAARRAAAPRERVLPAARRVRLGARRVRQALRAVGDPRRGRTHVHRESVRFPRRARARRHARASTGARTATASATAGGSA